LPDPFNNSGSLCLKSGGIVSVNFFFKVLFLFNVERENGEKEGGESEGCKTGC
jgi:hypothetical protein